ncbi:MAG: M28 family peptidase [Terriglobales bacterium]|jgi:peptidase M28-like protein
MSCDHQLLVRRLGLVAVFACALWSSAQTPPQSHFRLQTRAALEAHLKAFSTSNDEREELIRKWMRGAGCKNVGEQLIGGLLPPNLICVLPGRTKETIVVGAHTDKVDAGDGVVDNWTGAVLLPSLIYSLSTHSRRHTLIFIGFSSEEKGLLGSKYYVAHLAPEQRARIEAMVNFDSLGLGPTKVWASHADQPLLDDLRATAASAHLPLATENVDSIGASADSESFVRDHIPRVTLHSVTDQNWTILHSPSDTLAAIKMSDYYDSYKLIAEYLAYLDDALKPPPAADSEKPAQ